jgi:hypothetical protein
MTRADDIAITFLRSGGFGGITLGPTRIDLASLSLDERTNLLALVKGSGLLDDTLPDLKVSGSAPDSFEYDLTLSGSAVPGQQRVVHIAGSPSSGELGQLIQLLTNLAKKTARRR